MILPELPPMLSTVAAPLFLSAGSIPLILTADRLIEKESFHPLDASDPAGWHRSDQWLLGAPIEKEYRLPSSSSSSGCFVAEHHSGQWRTLQWNGSVQSATLMRPGGDGAPVPFHSSVGNEYLKVMASAYAALCDEDGSGPALHLGLGGGSLAMLVGEPCAAIELDEDVVDLAVEYCGLDDGMVSVARGGDALRHGELAPGPHPCVFVDVVAEDDNVASPFVSDDFVSGLRDELDDGGFVIANFHCNGGWTRREEDLRLAQGTQAYSRVFGKGGVVRIPSRYQGNMILCARKGGLTPEDLDVERARRVATAKGWMFDPGSRLRRAETIS